MLTQRIVERTEAILPTSLVIIRAWVKSNCWLKVHWSSISSISKVRLGGILVCVSWGVDILSCGRIQSWLNWTKVNTKNVYESSDMLGYSIWLKALHLWFRMLICEVDCPNTMFQSRHPKHGEFAFPRGMDRDAICYRMSRSIGDVVDLSKFSILMLRCWFCLIPRRSFSS